jgi:hypothetical protein
MSTSATKDQTTSSTSTPWAPQANDLATAFNGANGALAQGQGAVAPTDFTAQMSPEQLAAYQQMIAQGGDLSTSNTQAGTGKALQADGTSGVGGALTGLSNYNASNATAPGTISDAAQQYVDGQNIPAQVANAMLPAEQQARDVTMPGIEQNAAIGGNTNSTRTGIADGLVQRGLAEQDNNLTGSLTGAAYAHGLDLASSNANAANTANLGALIGEGNVGNTAANTGVNAGTASVATQGALSGEAAAGGAGITQNSQNALTNQSQQYQAQTNDPFAALNNYMGIVGANNWGSSTTGTNNTTSNPSAWDTISGLMSSAGSAAKGYAGLAALSDRRFKTNINRIGTLDNGLPVYAFVYKDDPEQRLNFGLMAQDVELVNPAAVTELDGIKVVDYRRACA